MEWYLILIIIFGSIILLAIIVLGILCIRNNKKNKENLKQEDDLYDKLIGLIGGYSNINDVNVNSSRLSVSLNDASILTSSDLSDFLNQNGIGLVKSSKKATFVIGNLASKYYDLIKANINN